MKPALAVQAIFAFVSSWNNYFIPAQGPKRMQGTARGRCFRFPHESPKRAFAISQGKRFVQHEPHLPAIGNAARLHANELRPFLFFRFTKLN